MDGWVGVNITKSATQALRLSLAKSGIITDSVFNFLSLASLTFNVLNISS